MVHFIPYVNNYGLLEKAYNSCRDFSGTVIVIDNRDLHSKELDPDNLNIAGHYHFKYTPPVPLTTAQTMNWMWKFAREVKAPFFTWQHSDANYEPGTLERLHEVVRKHKDTHWSVIFTHYDTLCAYNTAAVTHVNGWDYLRFPWYFLDNDIHLRFHKSGFKLLQANVGNINHEHSSTIRTDSERKVVSDLFFPVSEQLFRRKHPDFNNYNLEIMEA